MPDRVWAILWPLVVPLGCYRQCASTNSLSAAKRQRKAVADWHTSEDRYRWLGRKGRTSQGRTGRTSRLSVDSGKSRRTPGKGRFHGYAQKRPQFNISFLARFLTGKRHPTLRPRSRLGERQRMLLALGSLACDLRAKRVLRLSVDL